MNINVEENIRITKLKKEEKGEEPASVSPKEGVEEEETKKQNEGEGADLLEEKYKSECIECYYV